MENEKKIDLLGLLARQMGPVVPLLALVALRELSADPIVDKVIRDIVERKTCLLVFDEPEFRDDVDTGGIVSKEIKDDDNDLETTMKGVLTEVYTVLRLRRIADERGLST